MTTPTQNLVVARIKYKEEVLKAIKKTVEQTNSHEGLVAGLANMKNSVKNGTSVERIKLARGTFDAERGIENEKQTSFYKGLKKAPKTLSKKYIAKMLEYNSRLVELPQKTM